MPGVFGPGGNVEQAQKAAQKGVEGFGQAAQPYLSRQIGTALGNLNSTGALRSGAVPVALGDIATDYGREVGGFAKMAGGEALNAGLGASELDLERQRMEQQRKSSLLGAIGGLLGTGLGFAGAGGLLGKGIQKSFGGAS